MKIICNLWKMEEVSIKYSASRTFAKAAEPASVQDIELLTLNIADNKEQLRTNHLFKTRKRQKVSTKAGFEPTHQFGIGYLVSRCFQRISSPTP